MSGLFPPMMSFDTIDREALNERLIAWGHRMGSINRPEYTKPIDFALYQRMRSRGEQTALRMMTRPPPLDAAPARAQTPRPDHRPQGSRP